MNALRSMSVQSKMLVAFVFVTLLAIGAVSWIGYVNARDGQRAAAQAQLIGMQRTKANLVRAMLTATKNQVLSFSITRAMTEGSRDLIAAYHSIGAKDVTPEMKDAVRRFYDEEFVPTLISRTGISPVKGGFLPSSDPGWFVQHHYVAAAPRPYYASTASLTLTAADASAYARVIAGLHPIFERRLKLLGIEQMLVVERETMEVVYSLQPSTIFGTNLIEGPYASSNVASLARELRLSHDQDDYRMSDVEAYWPALGAAKGFVGAPVFDGPKFIAIMIVRFPLEPIENALNGNRGWEQEGLGRTGKVLMVGPDFTMRNDARSLIQDKERFLEALERSQHTARTIETVRRFGTTRLALPVKSEAARAAYRGQSGVLEVEDYRGERVVSAYGPLDLDSLRWAVLAEKDVAEVEEPLRHYVRRVLATAVGLSLVASMLALWLSWALTRPIADLVRGARRISKGEMDVAVKVAAAGEYRELGEAFNDMVQNLKRSREELDRQVRANERLLVSLLPASGAAQVREGNPETRQAFADVTVAFVNLLGFEASTSEGGDEKSMDLLSEIVGACDEAAEHHRVEKVRTIGSSYLAASGLSVERPDHTARMVEFAREVVRIVKRFNAERGTGLVAEIGINTGPVIGGLVGRRKFIYDLWGDTVKLARGIESDGHTSILVTRPVYERVRDRMAFEPAQTVEVRGMGQVELFSLAEEAMA